MDEVEGAQTRPLSLEREKGLVRNQLQTTNEETENKKSDNLDSDSILLEDLSATEKTIAELNMEIDNIETTLSNRKEEHMNDVKKFDALVIEKEGSLEKMKKELLEMPTTEMVDELRKKVKILQAMGYNSTEAEDWKVATSSEAMSKMEPLLLDINRAIEHNFTQLKVNLLLKASLLEKVDGKLAEFTEKLNEQQELIQKLRDGILKGMVPMIK